MVHSRRPRHGSALVALALVVGTAAVAQAHCCHDDREVLVLRQDSLRDDTQGRYGALGEGSQRELGAGSAPSSGAVKPRGSLRGRTGGLGELRGNSLGNYGAGSPGERGPGGLGALGAPPPAPPPTRPR